MSENNTNNKQEKVYCDGLWIKQKTFNDGGAILKVSVLVDKFNDFLKKHKKGDGFVNLIIKSRKEVKENGESHYAELDTWKPSVPTAPVAPKTTTTKAKTTTQKVETPVATTPESTGNDF